MNTIMNKIKKGGFLCLLLLGGGFGVTSCSDIMETESDRMLIDPSLSSKTDSIYYMQGILRGLQQLADQYVLAGEFRGDLISPNVHTSSDLRELSNFSADASNAYDSAYVYYRVINNCNYFIAHRDTTLMTGSTSVAIPEYVEAKAVRAWAYMQLAKNWGTVPFTLNPVTSISEAENVSETKDLQGIADALLPDLLPFSGKAVPSYGDISAGSTNDGNTKTVASSRTMLPIDLVIADLYLETNDYENAAKYYYKYLYNTSSPMSTFRSSPYYISSIDRRLIPNDMPMGSGTDSWGNIFQSNSASITDLITYIPMAVNKQKGVVSNLPKIFGYDYYSTNATTSERYLVDRMASPSAAYTSLVNAQNYYYQPSSADDGNVVNQVSLGDLRYYWTWTSDPSSESDSTFTILGKYVTSNVYIYRKNLVYLRLAEALNRMGYPDAAFAILKDGICATKNSSTNNHSTERMDNARVGKTNGYIRDTTWTLLTTTIPFLQKENYSRFAVTEGVNVGGVHSVGSGYTTGAYSPYQYVTEITKKLQSMGEQYSDYTYPVISPNDSTVTDSLDFYGDYAIDAVEDLICDELALETAGEGNRWGDLTRIARHKNAQSPHGANYGSRWLARKLAFKNPAKDLTNEENWYLPMK